MIYITDVKIGESIMLREKFLFRAFASILLPLFFPVAAWSQIGPAPGTYVYASCGIGSGSGGELTVQCKREAPRRNLRDVEFSAAELLATWVEQPEGPFGQAGGGFAFVAPLDPVTGEILTDIADVLPFSVPRISEYGNGPEWGFSQRGPEVYLTCQDQTLNQASLCRITRRSDGASRILQLANSGGFMSKDPSRNADSATPKIHYEIKGPGPKIYGWREDSPEGSDERIEDGLVSGRWMSDGRRLLLTGFGVGPSEVNRNLFIFGHRDGRKYPAIQRW